VIEAGEILPYDLFAVSNAKGMGDAAVRIADEPFRVRPGQLRVRRTVIDDQVHHHLQAEALSLPRCCLDLQLGWEWIAQIDDSRVDLEVVRNGVDAPRSARFLNGIDEYPVEPHVGSAPEMAFPITRYSSQQRKQVVDDYGCAPQTIDKRTAMARSAFWIN
jgi:hypothetical protein